MHRPTIDDQLEAKKRALGELGDKMQALTRLNEAVGATSWAAMEAWLAKSINGRYLELASPGTTMERTHALRGEIAALSEVRRLPADVLQGIADGASKAEVLQRDLEKWHTRGRPQLRSAVQAASQLAETSTQGPSP